ncbi:MAG TPA: sugar ABC transporter permease [Casimicrobiaceae bacterium]
MTASALPGERVAPRRRRALLDRERPLGYALVLPAVLYLALFIAYPFFMSIWLSLSDAHTGNRHWGYIGLDNYSKLTAYDLTANDFVLATFPTAEAAQAFVAAREQGKVVTTAVAGGARAGLEIAGRSIPLVEMDSESDAGFLADTVLHDLDWRVEHEGGAYAVIAHASDAPLALGHFAKRAELRRMEKERLLAKADTAVKTTGTGLLQDPNFLLALKNTVWYTFASELIKLLIGIPCALLLNRRFAGRRLLRGLVVIPWVIPIAISAQAWLWIFDSTYSVINWCLVHWGLIAPSSIINFRGDKNWAMWSLIAVNVWRGFPFTAIVVLAGLTAIPDDILERARVDGTNAFQRFVHIIEPMVRPILVVALLFSVIFTFTDFQTIWIITRGGPYDQTQVLSTYAYQVGVDAGYLGKGASISLFTFPILGAMVYFMLRYLRKEAT